MQDIYLERKIYKNQLNFIWDFFKFMALIYIFFQYVFGQKINLSKNANVGLNINTQYLSITKGGGDY